MAKDRRKVIHIHSSIEDRQPTPQSLEYGELGVNYNAGNEFISTKNSDDKVVRFSSDEQIVTIMEKKEVMPYEGLVRGAEGPGGSKDYYNSYGITNDDLLNNKSNIVIKLNQVAAGNTAKHNKVNGSKDIYNKLVNPTEDSGINDGAGFAIDMSRYAMQDANPQFSSTTNTCRTTMSGTTIIRGLDGTCGSLLDIKVATEVGEFATATNKIGTNNIEISGNTTLVVSGTTTETKKGNVTETNLSDKTENTSGNSIVNTSGNSTFMTSGNTVIHSEGAIGITAIDDITATSSESDIIITANQNICETAGSNATFYGVNKTNIGIDCLEDEHSTITNIFAENVVTIDSPITNISGDTIIDGCARATNFYQTSDINYKENIRKASFNKAINAYNVPIMQFNFKDDQSHKDVYGVIAQDVEQYGLEEIVLSDEFGKKSVDYTSLMMLKLAFLENENKILKGKLSELDNRVKELENKTK